MRLLPLTAATSKCCRRHTPSVPQRSLSQPGGSFLGPPYWGRCRSTGSIASPNPSRAGEITAVTWRGLYKGPITTNVDKPFQEKCRRPSEGVVDVPCTCRSSRFRRPMLRTRKTVAISLLNSLWGHLSSKRNIPPDKASMSALRKPCPRCLCPTLHNHVMCNDLRVR